MHAEGAPSEVEIVRSDNGGEFVGGAFGDVCRQDCIEQEFNNTKSPQFNGVAERTFGIVHGIIHNAALAAHVQPHNLVLHIDLHPTQTLRTAPVHGASEPRNRTGPIPNRDIMSPHDMWYGETAFSSPHPFLRRGYCSRKRPSKSFPRRESGFSLGPGTDNPQDKLRVLTPASKVIGTTHVTREPPCDMEMPTVQLQQSVSPQLAGAQQPGGTSEPGVTPELGETPEPAGLDDFNSGPRTPLPLLVMAISHQR